ncbi:hypothetical protein PR202_gb17967 [Eleusine coracana subsp. coracana]|uniref:Uncharacterized protein n=1 Tax=Eleusine coracana subsp. coracana TaxID=191504 RepID=A0AAV5F639_ELECO|nr:hypothetical protein PR202_gb17967 [Eleusine coracana subsp. coracana]
MAASSTSAAGDGADPMALVQGYNDEELAIAGEFLTTWLPFLSAGLCPSCVSSLRARVDSLLPRAEEAKTPQLGIDQIEPSGWESDPAPQQHLTFEPSGWDSDPPPPAPPPQQQPPAEKPKMSWADMAQEDELAAAAEEETMAAAADDGEEVSEVGKQKVQLSRDQREQRRYQNLVRKKDFICLERVRGRLVNILEGLELHTGVFSSAEQRRIVECVYDLQEKGKRGELGVLFLCIQYGQCHNGDYSCEGLKSVLILNGNGADVAKHCVPAVPTKRISITFRKMDPAKRPFSFKDDPELLNIAPLETVVQDTGRSSDEGKSRTPDAQIRNLSKISRGKRSKGRSSAGKAERGILGDQPPEHVEAPAVDVSSQQKLHGLHNVYASSSGGERNSGGRSRESRYHSDVPGMPSQVDDLREWRNRSAQERRHGNGMSSGEDGVDSGGRRQRMEHRQISFINRTIRDDIDSFSVTSRESADRSGSMVEP